MYHSLRATLMKIRYERACSASFQYRSTKTTSHLFLSHLFLIPKVLTKMSANSSNSGELQDENFRNHWIFPTQEGYQEMIRILKLGKGEYGENWCHKKNLHLNFLIATIDGEERIKSKKTNKNIIMREVVPTILKTYHDNTGNYPVIEL